MLSQPHLAILVPSRRDDMIQNDNAKKWTKIGKHAMPFFEKISAFFDFELQWALISSHALSWLCFLLCARSACTQFNKPHENGWTLRNSCSVRAMSWYSSCHSYNVNFNFFPLLKIVGLFCVLLLAGWVWTKSNLLTGDNFSLSVSRYYVFF